MRLPAGRVVGDRYRVGPFLGEGGMQEVYRATDTVLDRPVALKTPKTNDAERRFERSAQVSARINHPQVARTFDYFVDGRRAFLVEELIEGMDLGALCKRVPQLDPYLTARLLHGLARGLAAVHAVEVVHRDLKPSNLMALGGFDFREVKVTDFGVSRLAEEEIESGLAGGVATITGSKTLIGHLPYLAPEILRRRRTVHFPADIWAAGALAFHFLAGEPPFGAELADAVPNILSAPVPSLPEAVASHPQAGPLAQEIYGLVVACLQRDPASRPTAAQLVTMCERLCYPILDREVGTVTGYPGGSFGFADAPRGRVFFHIESVFGHARPRVGGEIWFSRHPGAPYDRAHPVVPILPEAP